MVKRFIASCTPSFVAQARVFDAAEGRDFEPVAGHLAHVHRADPAWRFEALYTRMRGLGFILYPGKLTRVDTFRIGCIGAIGRPVIDAMIAAKGQTLDELGIAPGA